MKRVSSLTFLCGAVATATVFANVFASENSLSDTGNPQKSFSIKQVMRLAHKEPLAKKVARGQATKDEKKQLLQLYEALAKRRPRRGSTASWRAKTSLLVIAARKAVANDPQAPSAMTQALKTCGSCHAAHK